MLNCPTAWATGRGKDSSDDSAVVLARVNARKDMGGKNYAVGMFSRYFQVEYSMKPSFGFIRVPPLGGSNMCSIKSVVCSLL